MTEVEEQTEFEFSELSERAKDAARQAYIANDYPHDDWWDGVFEDAVRMGALLGIQISTTHHVSSRKGHPDYQTTDIFFSGFWSQGDGASFEGAYAFVPGASAAIRAEAPKDKTLHRIADQFSLLQATRRLLGLEPFSATIKTTGGYCHSGTMDVTVNSEDDDDEHNEVGEDLEDQVTQLMRDFADWIYNQLETEHDHLTSDEVVDEQLAEEKFDEAGAVI